MSIRALFSSLLDATPNRADKCSPPLEPAVVRSAGNLSRRQFVIGAGAVISGFGILQAMSGEQQQSDTAVAGIVERVEAPDLLRIRQYDGRALLVRFSDSALFLRRVELTSLTSFVTGDEVVAEGSWDDERFVADRLSTLFRPVEGHILAREGDRIETTSGFVYLAVDTVIWDTPQLAPKALAELTDGDHIYALSSRDPSGSRLIAAQIGIVTHA